MANIQNLSSFEWVFIPSGETILTNDAYDGDIYTKQSTTIDVSAFHIGKYPITNRQYRDFIDDGGYDNPSYWTLAGWSQRKKSKWMQPRSWDESIWNGDDYPVVNISYYEAIAYCAWLSDKTGYQINLPTDSQWQRAAQGDDNRKYTWGNTWDGTRCNHSVKPYKSIQTTPVMQFEGVGDSPYGVVDMIGNVWDWCLTAYLTGDNDPEGAEIRILRGGAWFNTDSKRFMTTFRSMLASNRAYVRVGFRVAKTVGV